MKILLTSPGLPCGVDTITKYLYEEFNRDGDEADILYHWFGEPVRLLEGKTKTEKEFRNLEEVLPELVKKGYDIIHAHTWTMEHVDEYGGFRGLSYIKNVLNSPLIYTVHSIHVNDVIKDPNHPLYTPEFEKLSEMEREQLISEIKESDIFSRTQERVMNLADRITTISKYQLRLLKEIYPEFIQKSMIIPNGTNFEKYEKDPYVLKRARDIRRKMAPKNEKIILFAGRMVREKGVLDLAEAFNYIRELYEAKLVFVGSKDEKVENKIMEKINPSYRNDVFFVDHQFDMKDLAAYYKAADLTVVPSYHEGFGLVAIESISMKTPVVVSNVDAHKENLVDKGFAYGAEPRNPVDIAEKIVYALSHPEETKRMIEKANNFVKTEFNVKKLHERFKNLYQEVIRERVLNKEIAKSIMEITEGILIKGASYNFESAIKKIEYLTREKERNNLSVNPELKEVINEVTQIFEELLIS